MLRLASLAVIGSLALAPTALAQDGEPEDPRLAEVGEIFDQAEADFEAGRYEDALRGYERTMELLEEAGRPRDAVYLSYNIGLTNRRLRNLEAALAAFERYLAEAPADAPNRELAASQIAEIQEILPPRPPVDAPDGGGEVVSPIGIAVASVGAAVAIAGGIMGGVALSNSEAARDGCDVNDVCPTDARDAIANAQTLANIADGLLWGGLAVAATGVVLMFVLADSGDDASAGAFCTDEGCAATVQGRF